LRGRVAGEAGDEGAREQKGGQNARRRSSHGRKSSAAGVLTEERGRMVAWRAMREVRPTRQVPGEPRRRGFSSSDLDLTGGRDGVPADIVDFVSARLLE